MRALIWAVCSLLLSGCEASDVSTSDRMAFDAQPPALSACASNAIVRLSWDARSSGEQDVALFVFLPDGERLFAHGGAQGSQDTGPWVQPNTVFKLKSRDGSRELASLTVGSKDCGPATFQVQPAA